MMEKNIDNYGYGQVTFLFINFTGFSGFLRIIIDILCIFQQICVALLGTIKQNSESKSSQCID